MKRLIMVLLLVVVVLGAAVPAFAQDAVASVNTGSLNVRTGPGMQFGSVATLPFGFGVQMVARNSVGNWVLIQLTNGVTGWVNVNYLFTQFPVRSLPVTDEAVEATVTPTATNTGALNLNVRNGPSTDNAIIASVPLGTRFVLVGRSYDSLWALVRLPNNTQGCVTASSLDATVPVRSLALADGSVFVPNAPTYPPAGPSYPGNPGNTATYVVKPGDTLYAIALAYGTTINALSALNHIWNPNLIYAGQQILVPA
jgi:uncharacterized protein YgiM (DUF1202 family)